MSLNVVWFKKDLRIKDHAALSASIENGPTIGVFVIESEWLNSFEFDSGHYVFLQKSLNDLQQDLRQLGVPLLVTLGEVVSSLQQIHQKFGIRKLWSHEETGLKWTHERDLRVKNWSDTFNIPWKEFRQFGVIRPLKNRDEWLNMRNQIVNRPLIPVRFQSWPRLISNDDCPIPSLKDLGLPPSLKIHAQTGGRSSAESVLDSFLESRSRHYFQSLSSPMLSVSGCSRLSPFLSWGNLSITEVLNRLGQKKKSFGMSPDDRWWMKNLETFESRLAWHCHFIQKFESEPEIEFRNMNRAFDGMREEEFSEERFEAWCNGETGFPIIDAAMRSLKVTGWLNFRLRATVMSFAAYQLWLHWKKPAQFLAKHFIDFEPGIHFSQVQMQSGVTGINTIRIYSPKKQALEKDPDGQFIRQYCPELNSVPLADLAEPHLIPPLLAASVGFEPGLDYPLPIVDPEESYSQAKKKIYEWTERQSVRNAATLVYRKHGSRSRRHSQKGS